MEDFLKEIFAGLAGNPTVVHCTLLGITRIYYEFRDVFPEEVTEMLVNNVCLLLTSHSKEVVGAAISFLRVFVVGVPDGFCEFSGQGCLVVSASSSGVGSL